LIAVSAIKSTLHGDGAPKANGGLSLC
jgi:hypothetical protein